MNPRQLGLICVSLVPDSIKALPATLVPIQAMADVIEIRLDGMDNPSLPPGSLQLARPILATNRPVWEGGHFAGSEEARVELLCQAIEAGARYVDIELQTEPPLRERVQHAARKHHCKVIVSHHDFIATPASAQLQDTLAQMMATGADIGKIVTTASDPLDALRILSLQQVARSSNFTLCAFAMGSAGRISRLATLFLGGFMTYAALTDAQATAPGQLTLTQLRSLITMVEASHD